MSRFGSEPAAGGAGGEGADADAVAEDRASGFLVLAAQRSSDVASFLFHFIIHPDRLRYARDCGSGGTRLGTTKVKCEIGAARRDADDPSPLPSPPSARGGGAGAEGGEKRRGNNYVPHRIRIMYYF